MFFNPHVHNPYLDALLRFAILIVQNGLGFDSQEAGH